MVPRRLLPIVLALVLLGLAPTPAGAQWAEVERWLDGSQPFTFGLDASPFRVSNLGTRPVIAIDDPASVSSPYRFIDSDLRGTAFSVDLKLRWPSIGSFGTSALGAVVPYFSFGPMLFVQGSEGAVRGAKSEGAMSLGLSWGAGLAWRFARNAELFGGYRFMQYGRDSMFSPGERPSSSEPDATGHDVLYGINVRF
jgi:opacity protein-like surface antigen